VLSGGDEGDVAGVHGKLAARVLGPKPTTEAAVVDFGAIFPKGRLEGAEDGDIVHLQLDLWGFGRKVLVDAIAVQMESNETASSAFDLNDHIPLQPAHSIERV
jgi:hypothetical protein